MNIQVDDNPKDKSEIEGKSSDQIEGKSSEDPNLEEENTEDEDDDGELFVTIGNEEPEEDPDDELRGQKAPEWVKELRKKNREQAEELRKLRASKETENKAEQGLATLRTKPKMADHNYDDEEFEKDLEAWYEEKRDHDAKAQEIERKTEAVQEKFKAKVASFEERKKSLAEKGVDFETAEEFVSELLVVEKLAMIINGVKDPALMVLALDQNKKKAKELAEIDDLALFAIELGRLETQLKTSKRKRPPPAEEVVEGGSSPSGGVDKELQRLQKEADKSGDRTKVLAYKRKLRNKK